MPEVENNRKSFSYYAEGTGLQCSLVKSSPERRMRLTLNLSFLLYIGFVIQHLQFNPRENAISIRADIKARDIEKSLSSSNSSKPFSSSGAAMRSKSGPTTTITKKLSLQEQMMAAAMEAGAVSVGSKTNSSLLETKITTAAVDVRSIVRGKQVDAPIVSVFDNVNVTAGPAISVISEEFAGLD